MAGILSGNTLVYIGVLVGFSMLRRQQIRNAVIDSHKVHLRTFQGYNIIACRQIQILDSQKAYQNAFNIGKTEKIDLYDSLFGSYSCWASLDKEHIPTVKFAYNLIFFGLSGQVAAQKIDLETAQKILKEFRNLQEEQTDIDTSGWLKETDIGNIIKEFSK